MFKVVGGFPPLTHRRGCSPARPGIAPAAAGTGISSRAAAGARFRAGPAVSGPGTCGPALRFRASGLTLMPASASGRRHGCGTGDDRDARPGSAGRPPCRPWPQARLPAAECTATTRPFRMGMQTLFCHRSITVSFPPEGQHGPALGQRSHAVDMDKPRVMDALDPFTTGAGNTSAGGALPVRRGQVVLDVGCGRGCAAACSRTRSARRAVSSALKSHPRWRRWRASTSSRKAGVTSRSCSHRPRMRRSP